MLLLYFTVKSWRKYLDEKSNNKPVLFFLFWLTGRMVSNQYMKPLEWIKNSIKTWCNFSHYFLHRPFISPKIDLCLINRIENIPFFLIQLIHKLGLSIVCASGKFSLVSRPISSNLSNKNSILIGLKYRSNLVTHF